MLPSERDAAYLWDMLEAARDVEEFVHGVTFHQFSTERMRRLAVERALLVLGEAAKGVSPAFQRTHREVPWPSIVGLRNVLAHEYGEILMERVWLAATRLVPGLIQTLSILTPEPPEETS